MSLKMSILGLVSYKPMTGYDIYKLFDGSLKFFFAAQQSQIYRELNDLEKIGFVSARREEQESRPTRKIYSITQEGEAALFDWLVDYSEEPHFSQRLPYLTKIFFAAKIPDEELLKSILRFRELAKAKLGKLETSYANADAFINSFQLPKDDFFYWELTIDYGLRIFQMNIDWADRAIGLLESRIAAANAD
ncbi:MAG: PadR family transcriptional regulator [Oscillospiraceae bacterium]